MKITSKIFGQSFYYIGPGKDFEPLMRFSNQCRDFVYANLFIPKGEILEYIHDYFDDNPFLELVSIKVFNDFDETKYFELHPQYEEHLREAHSLLNQNEREIYNNIFVPAKKEKQWMIHVVIKRKNLNRKLNLYYFTAEGLASYIALSQNGKFPPKILCTIQTGVLERTDKNNLMDRFFKHTKSTPEQWIKGFEDTFYPLGIRDNSVLMPKGIFDKIGMDFSFNWIAGFYGPDMKSENRYCKAFIKKSNASKIIKRPFKSFDKIKNEIIYGDIYKLVAHFPQKKKLALITTHLNHDKLLNISRLEVKVWEHVLNTFGKISMKKSLNELKNQFCNKGLYDIIYFIPFGLEDEGKILSNFLEKPYKESMIAVVNRPLDLVDLRKW